MLMIVPETPLDVAATNVAASGKTAWAIGTSYTIGDEVRHQPAGSDWEHEFRAKQDHSGQEPAVRGNDYWTDLGAINQAKMFNGTNNQRTVADDPSGDIVVTIDLATRAHYVELLGLQNVSGVEIVQSVDGSPVATYTVDLTTTLTPVGWWSYYFGDRIYTPSVAQKLYGFYPAQSLTITLTGAPNAQCAQCIVGKAFGIGKTEDSANPRLQSYSTFRPTELGDYEFVPRDNTRQGTYTVFMETSQTDRVYQLMERYLETLVVLDANNEDTNFDALRSYGKITDYSPTVKYGRSVCQIKHEGIN